MYSPKINEELIPDLYKIAKAKKIPMVRLVNDILSETLKNIRLEGQVVREETSKEIFVVVDKPQAE